MNRSYFCIENLHTRFYVYYGNTSDLFVDETLYPLTIEQALHRELTYCGYQRIIFYSYAKGAYFLDSRSKYFWHGEREELSKEELFPKKMLKGRLGRNEVTESQENETMQFSVSSAEMLRYTEHFLNDSDLVTAVIFADGAEAIKDFSMLDQGKMLDNFFAQAVQAKLNQILNRNVVIFLFNRTKGEADENILSGIQRESVRKYLSDKAVTTIHNIPILSKQEIRNTLNYLRIYGIRGCRLSMDVSELEEISEMLAKRIAYNNSEEKRLLSLGTLSAVDLQGTIQFLMKNFMEKEKRCDLNACRKICEVGEELSAIQRLERLVGMNMLKSAIGGFLELQKNSMVQRKELIQNRQRLAMPDTNVETMDVNLHLVLTGGPGSGKNTVVELLGEIFYAYGYLPVGHTIRTTPGDLKGEAVGISERNVHQAVQQAIGGVLFIDEAYGLADDDSYSKSMVRELMADMKMYRGRFSLVLAGYPDQMEELWEINHGFRECFGENQFNIDDYTSDELTEIFVRMAEDRRLVVSEDMKKILPILFENWYYAEDRDKWSNARQARNLLDGIEKRSQDGVLTVELIPQEYKKYTNDKAEKDAMLQLDSLIGMQTVKKEIQKIVRSIKYEEDAQYANYIFAGNPGTGKTTVAKILGKILKELGVLKSCRIVDAKPDELIAEHVGGSTPKARKIFDSAMNGVLFIDEAYRLIPDKFRDDSISNDYGGSVMSLLLDYTDPDKKIPICFVCAGYERKMKEFLNFNEGLSRRFTTIHFDNYSPDELIQILKRTLTNAGYTMKEEYLAAALANFKKNIEIISERFNGGYIMIYFKESKDRLFQRLDKQYKDKKNIPDSERWQLKKIDAPDASWLPTLPEGMHDIKELFQ